MKKLLIISISIIIILALASSVMAKAVQLELTPVVDTEEEGWGKVILNNPAGTINLILRVNIKNAAIKTTYFVYIQANDQDGNEVGYTWNYLGDLLTNKAGNGSFKLNIKEEIPESIEKLTDIVVALNDPDNITKYMNVLKGEIEIK